MMLAMNLRHLPAIAASMKRAQHRVSFDNVIQYHTAK